VASVVIPTYNRCGLLRRTLETLTRQSLPAAEFEVIVSDDGSSDATAAVARSFSGRLRIRYRFSEDLGYRVAAARNAGARLATAPVLVFLDTGTLTGPGFLRAHLAAHSAGAARTAGAAGGTGGTGAGGTAVTGYCYGYQPLAETPWPDVAAELEPAQAVRRYGEDPGFLDYRHGAFAAAGFDPARLTAPWFLFWGMNCSVGADVFWAAGGYDENYRSYGVEDVDLGYRLFRRGVPFALARDGWTIELPHQRDLRAERLSVLRNARYFLHKYGGPTAELAYCAFQTAELVIESDAALLADWTRQSADLDVSAELAQAAADIPADASVVVFGCGGTVPAGLPPGTLLDFDARLLGSALADRRHTGLHAIGLRTPLPSRTADVVLITSRLRGLWDRWGDRLLAEARRIGRQVRGPELG
jgi:glycosyltransferase involved in cell wall biosynthesis